LGDIRIHGLEFRGRRVTNYVETPKSLECFFNTNLMFVEYDEDIYANESILNTPLTAAVLPLAWITGSDVSVGKLDKSFKESMDRLQDYFKQFYPLIPFKTKIHAEELVENQIDVEYAERRTGLLYSGGVDSTYSMIKNLELKPRLIMHWGVERTPYPVYNYYWGMVKEAYVELAETLDITFNITKSNASQIFNERKIAHRYHKELFYGSFWVRLQHSFVLLPMTAPLSVNRFDRLLIAASGWSDDIQPYNPYIQTAETDEKISWANLSVKHDSYIERYKKTREIAKRFTEGVKLRVCLNRKDAPNNLNCCQCEKCYRTIMQLAQSRVDPNKYGFKVDESTWENMRRYHSHKNELTWSDLNTQKLIPPVIDYDACGSKEFFEWLRGFCPTGKRDVWKYRDLYHYMPYQLAKILNEFYRLDGIQIHEATPDLPEYKVRYLAKLIKKVAPDWGQ